MTVKDWDDGQFVYSADMDRIEGATVMRFADAAERDSTLSGDLTPVAGMLAYVTGTGYQMYNGTAWVTVIGADTSTGWVNATITGTGIANFGAPYAAAGYRKLSTRMVILRGLIKTTIASVPANTTIFTLPAGLRPANDMIVMGYRSDGAPQLIRVNAAGTVQSGLLISASGSYVSLDGITFLGEA